MAISKRNEEYLHKCRSRVRGSQAWRKREGYDDLWDRLNDIYRGRQLLKPHDDSDRINVNIAFATINIMGPSISVSYPKITVNATRPENEDRAVIVEALINYWWRTHGVRPAFRRVVKDYLIFGFGFLKTGYRYVEEDVAKTEEALTQEATDAVAQADQFAAQNPDLAPVVPTTEEIVDSLTITTTQVVEDRPFVERVGIHDIFVDPEATDMEDIRWIAQRVVKDLGVVRKDKRYKSSARSNLKGDSVLREEMRDPSSNKPSDSYARVTLWEFYDLVEGTMCIFPDKGDEFLVEPTPQPYKFGHPFLMLRNYDVPDVFYPMGELESIEPLQQELSKTRSQQMNDRRRYARKYLYDRRAFDSTAVGILQSQRDGAYVPVNEGVQLSEAVIPLPQVPLDVQMYQQSDVIQRDIATVSGITEYQRGGNEQMIRRTATEASMIQEAANSRAAEKLAAVEEFTGHVARHIIMLAQQYMTEPSVGRIVGSNGAPVFFSFEPTWIQGEYDFEVEAGSTMPKNDASRRQQSVDLLQALAPFIPTGAINVPELIKFVVTGFGIRDPNKMVASGPPPPGPGGPPPGATMPPPEAGPPMQPDQPPAVIPPEMLAQLAPPNG